MYRYVELEAPAPTSPEVDPAKYCRERLQAAAGMARRGCRGDALAAQIELAVNAIALWEAYQGRPRAIRGWTTGSEGVS